MQMVGGAESAEAAPRASEPIVNGDQRDDESFDKPIKRSFYDNNGGYGLKCVGAVSLALTGFASHSLLTHSLAHPLTSLRHSESLSRSQPS